ncbi:MAG: hypothetical protein EBR88_07365, partial [Betaproteobacteria bacterium]|nr:hypothetical protein [Betaproteobacteria bacterium]
LVQSLPTIFRSATAGFRAFGASRNEPGASKKETPRTEQDLPMSFVLIGSALLVLAIWLTPSLKMNLAGALLMVLFGFLFVTVSSRLTGEIGSSSNPISGMTVATLLLTSLIFLALGWVGPDERVAALSVAAVVCVAASNGGTTSQDLKTGFLVGATPRAQQLALLAGVITSASVIGFTLHLLNDAGTITSKNIPQGIQVPDINVLTERETVKGPEGKDDPALYRVLRLREPATDLVVDRLPERCLVVGGLLRADIPLVAQRLRQSVRRHGAEVSTLHSVAEDLLMNTHAQMLVRPSGWAEAVLEIISAVAQIKSIPMPAGLVAVTPGEMARSIADSLCQAPSGGKGASILAGAQVVEHPQAGLILSRLQALAGLLEARFGVLVPGANVVGGALVGAIPQAGGANAADMLSDSAAAFLLVHLEPALDTANGPKAVANLRAAAFNGLGVVALTAYRSAVADVANVMLPIAPFTETSGSFVNLGGRLQSFEAAVRPLGTVRPG